MVGGKSPHHASWLPSVATPHVALPLGPSHTYRYVATPQHHHGRLPAMSEASQITSLPKPTSTVAGPHRAMEQCGGASNSDSGSHAAAVHRGGYYHNHLKHPSERQKNYGANARQQHTRLPHHARATNLLEADAAAANAVAQEQMEQGELARGGLPVIRRHDSWAPWGNQVEVEAYHDARNREIPYHDRVHQPEHVEQQYFQQRGKILDMLRSGLEAAGFAKVQAAPLETSPQDLTAMMIKTQAVRLAQQQAVSAGTTRKAKSGRHQKRSRSAFGGGASAGGLRGSSQKQQQQHVRRGNPWKQVRDGKQAANRKQNNSMEFGEGVFETKASTQRERSRIILLSNLTAAINPERAEELALELDDHIEMWTAVSVKDRKATGECPFCNVCVVESEWLRNGYGNPNYKPKKPPGATATATANTSSRKAAMQELAATGNVALASTGRNVTPDHVAPCQGCGRQLNIDIAQFQVFYTDPTKIIKRKSTNYSATNVKRSRAKIRKELVTAGRAVNRMVKAINSVMDLDADEEEATDRAEEAARRQIADARIRRVHESIDDYHHRISAVPGMLETVLLQGEREPENDFVARLHDNGLFEMATSRREDESEDAYAARLQKTGLFMLVTERWRGETDDMYINRIEQSGLLVAAFASRHDEQHKHHAARLQGAGVLTELLFRVQGKGESEFAKWIEQLGLQKVWKDYNEKMTSNSAVRNSLYKLVSRLQDHTLGRPAPLTVTAGGGGEGGSGQAAAMYPSLSSQTHATARASWGRAKMYAINHVHLAELQELERNYFLKMQEMLQFVREKKQRKDSFIEEPNLATVDEGEGGAEQRGGGSGDSGGDGGAEKVDNDDDAENKGGNESESAEAADGQGGGVGGGGGDADVVPEPDVPEKPKKKPRKKMPASGLSQSELQAKETADALAIEARSEAQRKFSAKKDTHGDFELEMYQLDVGKSTDAREDEEYDEARRASLAYKSAPPRMSVLGYMAEVVTISETTKERYNRVFESVVSPGADVLTLDQLCEGLKQVNHDLISDKMVEYCLNVLDIVQDTSAYAVKNDFKLFTTVARLAERMTFMNGPIADSIEDIDFDHGEQLKFNVLRARTMFYMGQSESDDQRPAISFDDFVTVCISGNVERHIPQMVIAELQKEGKFEIDFLDYLAYLPLFLDIADQVNDNPLSPGITRCFTHF